MTKEAHKKFWNFIKPNKQPIQAEIIMTFVGMWEMLGLSFLIDSWMKFGGNLIKVLEMFFMWTYIMIIVISFISICLIINFQIEKYKKWLNN